MSYIEHGPRIFCTGRPSNALPLYYGDYVLPRKRSEGRLKMYDSCSDIRAWSPNPMENSRYFRELAEHAPKPGKVVPFNVLIDNLIKMGSQAQDELELLRKELEKYKSVKLTAEQKEELNRIAKSFNEECKDQGSNEKGRSLSKIIFDTFQSESREDQREEGRNRGLEECLVVENKNVSVQVQPIVSDLAVQYDSPVDENMSKTSISSATPNSTVRDEKSFCSVNSGFDTTESSESESESRSAYESQIIEKESKIIALENEVQVKNAELEEREEKIKDMRMSVRSIKDVLDQKCHEVEDLRTKVHVLKFEKRKLQDSLDNESRVSDAQLDELNRLRFRIDQEVDIKLNLSKQLEQIKRERDGYARKVDMLQQQEKEKNRILAHNEEEIEELFQSWQNSTKEHEKYKAKTKEILGILETEVEDKNGRICEYEAQILNVEQEVGDMFIMLKTSLSEIEFIDKYECECNDDSDGNQSLVSQAKATISNLSLWVKQRETERKNLLKQLDDLKNEKKCIEPDCRVRHTGTYVNYESSTEYEETPKHSEVEIKNYDLDENEDRSLFKGISINLENSQDRLESQVTDQESTIEVWNCSFDKKIDLAFESHVTTSIIKIRKLNEGLKGKIREIEELKSEIRRRDLEITKLRSQMIEQSSQGKGDGDCYEREQADRNKRKLKLEEELLTNKHKLLGLNEANFILSDNVKCLTEEKKLLMEKYETVNQALQLRNRERAINEKYKRKVEEMQSRLRDLQAVNGNLMQELSSANKEIEKGNKNIQDLLDEKENLQKIIFELREEIRSKNSEIEYLAEQNFQLTEKLQKTLKDFAKLEESKVMKNRNVNELLQLQKEVRKLNKEKCRLEEKNVNLQNNFMEYQKQNRELDREVEDMITENTKLRCSIDILRNQYEVIVEKDKNKKKSMDYSSILLDKIKQKLDNCKLEEEEKRERVVLINRSTGMDAESEKSFSKDLLKEKEKIHLENESRQREDEIEKLKLELEQRNLEIQNMETLSTEELEILCQRIFSMIPSEEFLKNMHNKQNNYLQEDMSERQRLIEKVTKLEYKIAEVKEESTLKVEELESRIQEERNKSARLQTNFYRLYENPDHIIVKQRKNRNQNFESLHINEGINKDLNFKSYTSDQDCIQSTRLLCNQPGKERNVCKRKLLSGDESTGSRRNDFIRRCCTSMRHK
ncbi:GRIP and coiled-coil domain-containing protein 2-like isoform X2 [Belonocnema kinseyi]|uniref:GRIP and coiled-coil domain-containing protein 2-like isoform X2 n=1 Tax=Belonocnema kinseyi TaxID=2817044 RepID=UPI00143D9BF4|nr:GRIP and coiled-coil domain-containing protein 2-like isoform X2 [Belonocnema kinseyi]